MAGTIAMSCRFQFELDLDENVERQAPTPMTTRAWSPIPGPKTSLITDDAPLISAGNAVKPGAGATIA